MHYKAHITRLQDNYPDLDIDSLERRAAGVIRSTLSKGWIDKQAAITGEGGYDSMVFNAVIEVCAAGGDTHGGLKNYLNYLVQTYGRGHSNGDNKTLSLSEAIDIPQQSGEQDDSAFSATSPAAVALRNLDEKIMLAATSKGPAPTCTKLSESEIDFLDTYAHVGSVKEAAELAGVPYARARAVLANLRRWVRRNMAT